jgi:hypothetical protein
MEECEMPFGRFPSAGNTMTVLRRTDMEDKWKSWSGMTRVHKDLEVTTIGNPEAVYGDKQKIVAESHR